MLTTLKQWTINTVFPRSCVGCGVDDQSLCAGCVQKIVTLDNQHCVHCTKITAHGITCANCRNETKLYQLLSAAHYADGPLKEALHTLKYDSRRDLVEPLANLITNHAAITTSLGTLNPDIVTAVPQHRNRTWKRGFNQSDALARVVARYYRYHYSNDAITKVKATPTQASLHKKARQANLENVFRTISDVTNKTIVLIDDITTTGSTLNECAKTLREAGAKRVIGITVARTD